MDGSREKSSGAPPPRAEEIPTAIDEVLNRIKVKDLSFLEICIVNLLPFSDDAKGVRGDDGQPGGDPHQDHHG